MPKQLYAQATEQMEKYVITEGFKSTEVKPLGSSALPEASCEIGSRRTTFHSVAKFKLANPASLQC
ncbi:hypothetical protein [Rubripirellula reticaptiva]|uniref:Uncharacterized protein n=1 Tax=Rubripirellula reticaptiva TaxID=2528013 RepID=A0A5C6EGX4_9BACT|nr:hypothetical protein [Rubripirellula reticaptiva]TWU46846.1 hypothetical protein Poly59_58190 [Rubripirellula reticaptiva]